MPSTLFARVFKDLSNIGDTGTVVFKRYAYQFTQFSLYCFPFSLMFFLVLILILGLGYGS